uniref:Uncharacterized protein n=1 Tax=Pristionchus pacificus TaxID=54126 RepID=A0A2A6BUP1_PRIPA|eukprot:PDM69536.1 hypothetical protein PRIPAC_44632 [Pristionchus pacificus]
MENVQDSKTIGKETSSIDKAITKGITRTILATQQLRAAATDSNMEWTDQSKREMTNPITAVLRITFATVVKQ